MKCISKVKLLIFYIVCVCMIYHWLPNFTTHHNKSQERKPKLLESKEFGFYDVEAYLKQLSSEVEAECSQEYGFDLINRWRKSRIDVCDGFGQSSVTCYRRAISDHPRLFCVSRGAEIRPRPPFYNVTVQTDGIEPSLNVQRGFHALDCQPVVHEWVPKNYWFKSIGYFMNDGLEAPTNLNCTHLIKHCVIWINRYDEKNAYLFTEDALTLFETFLVLGRDPRECEAVFYDGLRHGHHLYTFWPIFFNKFRLLRQEPFPEGTCFAESIFAMHPGKSHLSNNKGDI